MGKKKAAGPGVGSRVKVLDGVTLPEAEQFAIGGWTGEIVEVAGKGAAAKYVIQWDDATTAKISPELRQHCDANGWLAEMACLSADQVEVHGGGGE
jgi:hypothetical protein